MTFRLEIISLDMETCGIILNGRFVVSSSFPLQEEWLMQAIFSALRSQGYEPFHFFGHQNVIPKIIPFPRGKKAPPSPNLTLEDLGL